MSAAGGRERGATLVELAVGLLVLGMLAGALTGLWILVAGQNRHVANQALAQARAQAAALTLTTWIRAAQCVSGPQSGDGGGYRCSGTKKNEASGGNQPGSSTVESLTLQLPAPGDQGPRRETLVVDYASPTTGAPGAATRCQTAAGAPLYPLALELKASNGAVLSTQTGVAWQPGAALEPLLVAAGGNGDQGASSPPVTLHIAGFAGACASAHLAPLDAVVQPQAGRPTGAGL